MSPGATREVGGGDGAPCYAFAVRRVRELTGIALPPSYADALRADREICRPVPPREACEPGDLVEIRVRPLPGEPRPRPHVAVAVDAFEAEHDPGDGAGGPGTPLRFSIHHARAAGAVVRVLRPVPAPGRGRTP